MNTRYVFALWAALGLLLPAAANAGAFAASASPSRFELQAKPGDVISRTLEIQHVGSDPTEYAVRSADWVLTEERGLEFFDALQPGSCRQWVRLERHNVKVEARSRKRFRFEVHVPREVTSGECRFALLIENYEQKAVSVLKDAPISLPLTGRLGIIVYVAFGGAQPKLELTSVTLGADNGEPVPVANVRNDGNAHGRLEGALRGVDATGKAYYFPVSTLPVMPGQTRQLPLLPAEDMTTKKRPKVVYPVKLSGRLDWDNGQFDVQAEIKKD